MTCEIIDIKTGEIINYQFTNQEKDEAFEQLLSDIALMIEADKEEKARQEKLKEESKKLSDRIEANRFVGEKYEKGYKTATEIAKLIRNELKESKKNGELPKDLKTSVRKQDYSMGRSITISIKTECSPEVIEKVKEIGNRFNYDDSDIMTDYFDVDYYLHVDKDWN